MPRERVPKSVKAALGNHADVGRTEVESSRSKAAKGQDVELAIARYRLQGANFHLASIAQRLEAQHFGQYVMINPVSERYVIAPTASEAHAAFVEAFGSAAPGHCLRIGVSPFATA